MLVDGRLVIQYKFNFVLLLNQCLQVGSLVSFDGTSFDFFVSFHVTSSWVVPTFFVVFLLSQLTKPGKG